MKFLSRLSFLAEAAVMEDKFKANWESMLDWI